MLKLPLAQLLSSLRQITGRSKGRTRRWNPRRARTVDVLEDRCLLAATFNVATTASGLGLPASVAIADFNSDGNDDIAFVDFANNEVGVQLGDGTGGFTASTLSSGGNNPISLVIDDFNNDSHADIAVANAISSNVQILVGNGLGGFSAGGSFATGTAPWSIRSADFNNDGNADFVVANADSNTVSLFLGDGGLGFTTSTFSSGGTRPRGIEIGDFNSDSLPDVVVTNAESSSVQFLMGTGAGFSAGTNVGVFGAHGVVTGDVNADGHDDAVVIQAIGPAGSVTSLLSDGLGGISGTSTATTGDTYPLAASLDDFDNDGDQDLVVSHGSGSGNLLLMNGDGLGNFVATSTLITGTRADSESVASGDFNNDGRRDLALAKSSVPGALFTFTNTTPGPVTVAWDGGGTTSNWSEAANWTNDTVPGTGDFVTIDLDGGPYTVTYDVNISTGQPTEHLGSLTIDSSDVTFNVAGRTLTVDGPTMVSDGTINLTNATVAGTGTFTNQSLLNFNHLSNFTSTVSLVNEGEFVARTPVGANGITTVNGPFTNAAGGNLLIQANGGNGSSARLTANSGLSNAGTITLDSIGLNNNIFAARLDVNGGALVNSGLIESLEMEEVGGEVRQINAEIDNRLSGIINVDSRATVTNNKVAAHHSNAGQINLNSGGLSITSIGSFDNQTTGAITGRSLTLAGLGVAAGASITNDGSIALANGGLSASSFASIANNGAIQVAGGNASFSTYTTLTNTADIDIGAGRTMTFTGGTVVNQPSGTIDGEGTLTFSFATLDVSTGSYVTGTQLAAFNLNNATVTGTGSFTNQSLLNFNHLSNFTSTISLVNEGDVVTRTPVGGVTSATVNGPFDNGVTGTLLIQANGGNGSSARLTANAGLTNAGTITLDSIGLNNNIFAASLNVNGGALVNTGLIESLEMEEVGGEVRQLNAEIDNRSSGTINVDSRATVTNNKFNAHHRNAGQILVSNGSYSSTAMASFDNSGTITGPFSVSLTGGTATDSFTNTGSVDVGGTLTLSSFASILGTGSAGNSLTVTSSQMKPGLSPGIFRAGNYRQQLGGTFQVEIGGNTPGNGSSFHDQLDVTGTVDIQTNIGLSVVAFAGYAPQSGDSYVIISNDGNDAVTGHFNGLPEGSVISTNFLGFGETATITYAGGTNNNDVVIQIVDTVPPAAPTTPDLIAASDSGVSDTDNITNDQTPTFSGTAEPGSLVELFSDVAGSLGTVAADSTTGAWSLTSGGTLAEGPHTITATATDAALNQSPLSGGLPLVIDSLGPSVTIDVAAGQADPTLVSPIHFAVVFSEAVTTFDSSDVTLSGTAGATTAIVSGSGTSYQVTVSGMTQGGSVVIDIAAAVAIDMAGNANSAATIVDQEVTFEDVVYDFAAAAYSVNELSGNHATNVVEVFRSGNTSLATSVDVVLTGVGATSGSDFTAGPVTLSFSAGETSRVVPIEILGDSTVELNETFALSLSGFSGTGQAGVTQPSATFTIVNDDSAEVSLGSVSQAETDGGQTTFLFDVTLSEQVDVAVDVTANTADGTATLADGDYVELVTEAIRFAPAATGGPQTQTIAVQVEGDLTVEPDEVFDLILSSLAAGGRDVTFAGGLATEAGQATILNDDATIATLFADDASASEANDDARFTVTLSQPSSTAVEINYVIGGTATNGTDFAALSGAVTVPANQLTTTIDINVTDDLLLEGSETVVLTLTTASGGVTIGAADSDQVEINDNENLTVEFLTTGSSLSEATIEQNISLRLAGAAGVMIAAGVSVSADIVDAATGTATSGTDYAAFGVPTIIFGAGAAVGDVRVVTLNATNDAVTEPDESIHLQIDAVTGPAVAVGPQAAHTALIVDNDLLNVEFGQAAGGDSESAGGNLPQLIVTGDVQTGHSVSIDVAVTGGTATAVDFSSPTTLTIGGGSYAAQAFSIPTLAVTDDDLVEPAETLELSNITGSAVTVGPQSSAIYTILDDDAVVVAFNQAAGSDTETAGGNLPQFVVTGHIQPGHSVSVNVSVTGGTATAADFVSPTTLTVPAGSYAAQTFAIPTLSILADAVVEPAETIQLGNITGAAVAMGEQTTTTYTIADDDRLTVEFRQAAGQDVEAVGANLPALLVTGEVQSGHSIAVNVGVTGGTATTADFTPPTPLTIGPGSYARQTFAIPALAITDDDVVEPTESIELGNISGAAITVGTQSVTTYTITDDDSLLVAFSQAAGTDVESAGGHLPSLLVTGTVEVGHSVSVDVAITGGTATTADYSTPTTLTVGTGSYTAQAFLIPDLAIIDDAAAEPAETIELGGISGSAITVAGPSVSTYTIIDDDTAQANDPPVITGLTSSHPDVAHKSDDGIVTINGTFADLDPSDLHTATVNWGDGSALESISVDQLADSFTAVHTYAGGGTYTILVTIDDGRGGTDARTTSAVTAGIGLVDDRLYVISGDGHDRVKVREQGGQLRVDMWLNGHRSHHRRYESHAHESFAATDVAEIIIITCDGHDRIDALAAPHIPIHVDAGNGHDVIWTGGANDVVMGGRGDDYIRTFGGNDTIDAGRGNDIVISGDGADVIEAGAGHDSIQSGDGDDLISAGRGHDWIDAGSGDDTIFAGAGNDVVHAGAGQDIVFGGAGDDCLHGEDGADLLFGGRGHDYLNGGRGRDLLIGGDGRDVIKGGQGNDLLIGGRLKTDWESLFDKSLLDTAIAEWATGDLADTMMILGAVIDDDEPDYLFGQQGCDTLIAGRRDARWQ